MHLHIPLGQFRGGELRERLISGRRAPGPGGRTRSEVGLAAGDSGERATIRHACILLATALVGYTAAREESLLTVLLFPFPLVYYYKRYEKARTDSTQSDTPV